MPALAGAAHADRTALLGHVGYDDDLWAARHAPSFAEDVELDLAKTVGEGDLLRGIAANVSSSTGPAKLTPRISAPSAAPVGTISIDIGGSPVGYRAILRGRADRKSV